MRPTSAGAFGDAGGFGDVEDPWYAAFVPPRPCKREPRRRGGFGDADGFGDAGGFDFSLSRCERKRPRRIAAPRPDLNP
jgi:hypothetical protein